MSKLLNSFVIVSLICFFTYGFVTLNDDHTPTVQSSGVVGLNIGNTAPELNYNDPNGKSITLSSLKGQVVLIDFWASWCGPCRRENPNVVRVYEQFKDKKFQNGKGFNIYGVSLDNNKVRWEKAIVSDRLNWESHVSDLKGWSSAAAKTYKVGSIPSNFLIDGDGVIIAKNLRGPALENALQRIVKN